MNKSAHTIIVAGIYGTSHLFSVGTEMMVQIFPRNYVATLPELSHLARSFAAWVVIFCVVPRVAAAITRAYAIGGQVFDAGCALGKRALVAFLRKVLERLNRPDP